MRHCHGCTVEDGTRLFFRMPAVVCMCEYVAGCSPLSCPVGQQNGQCPIAIHMWAGKDEFLCKRKNSIYSASPTILCPLGFLFHWSDSSYKLAMGPMLRLFSRLQGGLKLDICLASLACQLLAWLSFTHAHLNIFMGRWSEGLPLGFRVTCHMHKNHM